MSFGVNDILKWTDGRLANADALEGREAKISVSRPVPLASARPGDLAFFFNRQYQSELHQASPGVLITGEPFVKPLAAAGLPFWKTCAVIACEDPYLAMALLSEKFAEELSSVAHLTTQTETFVHPSAVVHPTVELGKNVRVGAHCVIEAEARIGAGTVLYAGCFVGTRSVIGESTVLFPGVTVYEWTEVGSRVRLHAGVVLGSDGFGYAPKRSGKQVIGHQKIFHLGRVVVEDDVEIGANSCVDRGTFGETRIGKSAKLDNLVHIGHNSRLDEGAIVCGGTCLAGNASLGKFAYVGGLTGITNHVHVGDGASVGALSLVTKDVPPGATAVGNPQREHREHFKAHALLSRMLAERKAPKSANIESGLEKRGE